MKTTIILACLLVTAMAQAQQPFHYPSTKRVDVTDSYFGHTIPDPYRWLEDIKDSTVLQWFREQSEFTNNVLSTIPGSQTILDELEALDKITTVQYYPVGKAGERYFYEKRLPGEQTAKLYYRDGEQGEEILLFDPEKFIDGKVMDMTASPSHDGAYILLTLSEQGSEVGDIHIMEVKTKRMLPDKIPHADGYFVENTNDKIIYIQRKSYDTHDPQNSLNMKLRLHIVGTPVENDKEILGKEKYPELGFKSEDWPYILHFPNSPYIFAMKATVDNNMELFYANLSELEKERINWHYFCNKSDEIRNIFVDGSDVYCLSTKGNDKFRIFRTTLPNPDFSTAEEIIAGNDDWKMSDVMQAKDYLIINQSKNDLQFKVSAYSLRDKKTVPVDIPLDAVVYMVPHNAYGNECFIIHSGWNMPFTFYKYDMETKQLSNGPLHVKNNYPGIENIVYKEIEVASHDGAMVPLSIVYDKTKLKEDGTNICLMSGYGAYGMSPYLPLFSKNHLPLLKRGVVLAYAHVRGGGEKGNDWYLGGKKTTKPNTWKDFNACAEYLIRNQYTSPQRLGCTGASAGGILIGRAITERPDLYKVAIPKVGCLNSLRMEFSPNGPVNTPEFGTVTDSIECLALIEMDALYHVQKGVQYPAQLITTGFNDPRVESYIPAKFAAAMQAANNPTTPVLLYVDYSAGHFGGTTIRERFTQASLEYAFLLWQCGYPEFQVK